MLWESYFRQPSKNDTLVSKKLKALLTPPLSSTITGSHTGDLPLMTITLQAFKGLKLLRVTLTRSASHTQVRNSPTSISVFLVGCYSSS